MKTSRLAMAFRRITLTSIHKALRGVGLLLLVLVVLVGVVTGCRSRFVYDVTVDCEGLLIYPENEYEATRLSQVLGIQPSDLARWSGKNPEAFDIEIEPSSALTIKRAGNSIRLSPLESPRRIALYGRVAAGTYRDGFSRWGDGVLSSTAYGSCCGLEWSFSLPERKLRPGEILVISKDSDSGEPVKSLGVLVVPSMGSNDLPAKLILHTDPAKRARINLLSSRGEVYPSGLALLLNNPYTIWLTGFLALVIAAHELTGED